jgi:hypothetical protein
LETGTKGFFQSNIFLTFYSGAPFFCINCETTNYFKLPNFEPSSSSLQRKNDILLEALELQVAGGLSELMALLEGTGYGVDKTVPIEPLVTGDLPKLIPIMAIYYE